MSHDLTPETLARAFGELASNRKEGVLRVERDGFARAIFLRDGCIIRVDSELPGESFAETLDRAQKVKRSDLELAVSVMNQTGEPLGKTLTEMGLIAPADVASLELERSRAIVRRLLEQSGGVFHFDERAIAIGAGEEVVRIALAELVPTATPPPPLPPPPPPASSRAASRPSQAVPAPKASASPAPSGRRPAPVKARSARPVRPKAPAPSGRGRGKLVLAALVLASLAAGALLFVRGRDTEADTAARNTAEAASGGSPATSAPAVDVTEDTGGPTDAELFAEATLAFAEGDLLVSKATLETLLERTPDFVGASELLLRVEEDLVQPPPAPVAAASPPPAAREPAPEPAAEAPPNPDPEPESDVPNDEARQLAAAREAYARGDFAASRAALDRLLRANPSHAGAVEFLAVVDEATWQGRLPMVFPVAHNHRFGGCNGTLSLQPWGIGFTSEDHGWQWGFGDMRSLERDSRWLLNIETHESDRLSLGGSKNYKFQFEDPIPDEDWARFQRLAGR